MSKWELIGDVRPEKSRGKESGYYCARWRLAADPKSKVRQIRLALDKRASIRIVAERIEKKAAELMAEMEPAEEYEGYTPLDHLEDYIQHLQATTTARRHPPQVRQHITEMFISVITSLDQISASQIERFLAKQRRPQKGKKKPRHSEQTSAHWRASAKAFTHWLEIEERVDRDPLRRMCATPRGDMPITFKRRAIKEKDFNHVVQTAGRSKKVKYNFTGPERAALYITANLTGLRASELASLTPRSFNLDAGILLIDCTISKRRRYDKIHLSDSLCEYLADYLAGKPENLPVWPGCWPANAGRLLRVDLEDAGVPYENAKGRLDFHALGRHSFCTNIGHMQVSPIVMQRVCRFSTPSLLNRYVHINDEEKRKVVAALPRVKI